MGDAIIACVRVDDGGIIALGSVTRACEDCDAPVYVAPSGLEIIERRGALPVCLACVAVRVQRDGAPTSKPMSPVQLAEALATLSHYRRRN